uniref:tRNA-splicing endonuclease subunit Sen54 N-terminal domain-containing protein n=1 Tax=Anopheles quadriannulatus TaxID=34691 RepID=A0A182X4K1_ANOQN
MVSSSRPFFCRVEACPSRMAGCSEGPHGLLSGQDIVKHHTESYEVNAQFNKLVSLEDFDETRKADLERMKEQLRCLLSQERVNKTESLSEGVWESEHRRIRLTRVEGKWQSFGYEDSTGKYVECYEGLFLMEMNRLMVKWNGVVVSIEQGYSLLLGHPGTLTLEEYQVYSTLIRSGYYVLRYERGRKYCTTNLDDVPPAEEWCVWSNLYEMLNQPNPRKDKYPKQEDGKLYETVRRSMQRYGKLIRNPAAKSEESTDEPTSKKHRPEIVAASENHSDGFSRIEHFRRMFDRFDIVHSLNEEGRGLERTVDPPEENDLRPVFDLFATESQTFKKSFPPLPIARIIVRRSSQRMLHFRELHRMYQQQEQTPVPLMLMLVSDNFSVHCFLYDMKRVQRNVIALTDDNPTRAASSSFARMNRPC